MISNVKIIIRSAGERTEDLCRALILSQGICPEKVVTVRETPFSAAMRKSFEIGLESDLPWTFCIDADVLLRPGSIQRMLEFADWQTKDVCEIQAFVICKFFGGPRTAGNHLYRTSLLERVIANIPAEGTNIRPEFHTLETMKAQGHPWSTVPYLIGLHDFEQYHRDIFRKCFVQAHKHAYLTDLFLRFWRANVLADEDYRVALAGFARGVEHCGPIFINAQDSVFHTKLEELGLEEKSAIADEKWSLERTERIIQNWQEPEIYREKFPNRLGLDAFEGEPNARPDGFSGQYKLRKHYHQLGFLGALSHFARLLLAGIGQRLQMWATTRLRR